MLSASGPHVYVTRNATLAYQKITGERYETARCELTRRLLSAVEDPEMPGCYLLEQAPSLRAYTRLDGGLLFVPKIMPL
jgi:hypothetical protein